MNRASLTPSQLRVVEELLDLGGDRPTFASSLPLDLLNQLEDGLSDIADRLGPLQLGIRKSTLSQVHQCEAHHLAERDVRFEWTTSSARGTIAHRALQLSVFRKEAATPLELVDEAIERITETGDDWTPRDFLRCAAPAELAELRSEANDIVTKFTDSFPPLSANWRPRLESGCRVELCAGRIVLRSKVDLALGQPVGTQARVLIVDFKTGRPHPTHMDDLRYYALLECLRSGVPPFRIASYYLESARWQHEDVGPDLLQTTALRVIHGATKLAELTLGEREATVTPGPSCTYCRLRDSCPRRTGVG